LNLRAAAVVLRPRELSEQLDLACRLCMSIAFGLFARLAATLLLPAFVGCLVLRHAAGWSWVAVWALAVVLGNLLQGVFTVSVGRLLFSEELSVGQALRLFAGRFGAYVTTLFLSRCLMVASFLLAWPRMVFVHEACLLEAAGPGAAIQRSGKFTQGRTSAAFGVLVALLLTQAAFVVTAELLGHGVVSEVLQLGKPFGSLVDDGGSAYALAGFLLSIPYVASARFLSYIDGRTRADGWDIQVRFLAIAGAQPAQRAVA
jgi:hypothetical protein